MKRISTASRVFVGAGAIAATAAAATACDRHDGDATVAPASASSVASALGVDAAEVMRPVDPTPPPGDLKTELDRFTTLDACVAEHASLDPLVGDAIRSLGYETFLRDACRVLEAAKARSTEPCTPIVASELRTRCRAVVAMVTAAPELCPPDWPAEPLRGRDPRCVAVAARDPRLCAAETSRGARPACEALVARDPAKCNALVEPPDKAACTREVTRWQSVIDAPPNRPKFAPIVAKIDLKGADGSAAPNEAHADLEGDFARGVVVAETETGLRIAVGPPADPTADRIAEAPNARTRVRALLAVAGTRATKGASAHPDDAAVTVERLDLLLPGAPPLGYPGVRCDCRARVTEIGAERGAHVALTIDGTIGVAPNATSFKIDLATYVRDVVALTRR